jgi:hypothetical protein
MTSIVPSPMQPKQKQPGLNPMQPPTANPAFPRPTTLGGVNPQGPVNVPPIGTTPTTGGFNMQSTQSSFGPGNNLIGQQISPIPSSRLGQAQGMTTGAAQGVGSFGFSPLKSISANTNQSQGIYDKLLGMMNNPQPGGGGGYGGMQLSNDLKPYLDKVANAPDRGQLAQDMYGVLEERARPGFDQRLRSVGQKAAAWGRMGAGLTTSELGDVEMTHNRDLDLSRRQLAAEGAGYTLDDRLKQLGAAKDVFGAVSSANNAASMGAQELNQQNFNNMLTLGRDIYGRESDAFGRDVGERNYSRGDEYGQFDVGRSKLGDLSSYEQQITNNERGDRDEYRGERGYQYGLERDALGDRERQYGMEEDAYDRDWQRAMQMAQFGYGQNPSGAYAGAAQGKRDAANAATASVGPMFTEWARGRNQPPTRPKPVTPAVDYIDVPPMPRL